MCTNQRLVSLVDTQLSILIEPKSSFSDITFLIEGKS